MVRGDGGGRKRISYETADRTQGNALHRWDGEPPSKDAGESSMQPEVEYKGKHRSGFRHRLWNTAYRRPFGQCIPVQFLRRMQWEMLYDLSSWKYKHLPMCPIPHLFCSLFIVAGATNYRGSGTFSHYDISTGQKLWCIAFYHVFLESIVRIFRGKP